jgi:hypothetical protein
MLHMILTLNTSYFFKQPELVVLSNVGKIGTEFLCNFVECQSSKALLRIWFHKKVLFYDTVSSIALFGRWYHSFRVKTIILFHFVLLG